MEKKKKKNSILLTLLIIFLFLAVFASLALFFLAYKENAGLKKELATAETELTLRRIASEQATLMEIQEEQAYEAEVAARSELRQEMMRRDREELLMLVNKDHQIPDGYTPRLVDIGEDKTVDERCALSLARMIADCKEAYNAYPVPISAYRTAEYQQELYENKIERVIASGVSEKDAPEEAAAEVAPPGTSEHQTGFAVDISDAYHTDLDYGQEWTATQQWLMAHCTDYGFILRYPSGTTDITGIIYEPWHYRYVGVKAAKEIEELGITLEEYIQMKEDE